MGERTVGSIHPSDTQWNVGLPTFWFNCVTRKRQVTTNPIDGKRSVFHRKLDYTT